MSMDVVCPRQISNDYDPCFCTPDNLKWHTEARCFVLWYLKSSDDGMDPVSSVQNVDVSELKSALRNVGILPFQVPSWHMYQRFGSRYAVLPGSLLRSNFNPNFYVNMIFR